MDTTPTQNSIAYHISKYKFVIETSWWSIILIPRDKWLCQFCCQKAVKNEACFVWECHLYNSIEDVVLGSLKFLFQLDHQVGISIYLAKATPLHHSKELALFWQHLDEFLIPFFWTF